MIRSMIIIICRVKCFCCRRFQFREPRVESDLHIIVVIAELLVCSVRNSAHNWKANRDQRSGAWYCFPHPHTHRKDLIHTVFDHATVRAANIIFLFWLLVE